MGISEIVAVSGLLLLIGIFVLLMKREKQGKNDSKKLSAWQAILLTVGDIAVVVLIIMIIISLPDIWTWLFSLLFGDGSSIS